jgi:hypothetical protein
MGRATFLGHFFKKLIWSPCQWQKDPELKIRRIHKNSGSRLEAHLTFLKGPTRVARWFVFKPKIPIWVNFGGS